MLSPADLKERLPQAGALVFAPTPFVPGTLELDVDGFRRNIEFIADGGIRAVAVAGFVGEFSALNYSEYETVLRTARSAFGDGIIVAGVGFGTALATEYAAAAERNGADCAMILPPYLVEPTEDGLIAHTAAIANASRLGVMVHSMPGYPFTARLVERMAAIQNVVSYKDELGDVRGFAEIVDHVGDQLVYVNGRAEPVWAYYAAAGATVLATAIGNFDPRIALQACSAAAAGDYAGIRDLLAPRAMPWYRLRERNRGYLISVSKASMNLVGLSGGAVRPPLSDLGPEVEAELVEILNQTEYLEATR